MYGTKIGRFVVIGELGQGGMGIVFKAHDRELDRKVALKVLRGSTASAEERTRMLREGQAMARVTHPNVITVYEVGSESGLVYLAQELLDGGTLGQWLEHPRGQREILDRFIAAGRGLAAAHAAKLVHRDFKPDNVLLGKDGRVRVADFGLARSLGAGGDAAGPTTRGVLYTDPATVQSPMSPLTRTGAVMGTPMFMAPEQHEGQLADERSDQFSFCVALYHGLYGDWPFAGKTSVALADSVIEGRVEPPPKGHAVPSRLRKVVLRGLATSPAARYPSMDALLAELAPFASVPKRGGRWLAIAGGVALLGGGVAAGAYALRSSPAAERADAKRTDTKVDVVVPTSEWLSEAIERGLPNDAIVKYDLAAQLLAQQGEKVKASIPQSAGVIARVLAGRLAEAQAKLRAIDANKGDDALARSYADLATAAVALASGDLKTALAKSQTCAGSFARGEPLLSALCLELQGSTSVEMGFAAGARTTYQQGLAIAKQQDSLLRGMTIELALAELDLDESRYDRAVTQATALQTAAGERAATGPEVEARILLARALIAQASTQKALEVLEPVKREALQSFRVRIAHAVALGEANALLGDASGLDRIEAARAEAERNGYTGLVLEARFARLYVLDATGAETAKTEKEQLVKDARAAGYHRIERLAQNVAQP